MMPLGQTEEETKTIKYLNKQHEGYICDYEVTVNTPKNQPKNVMRNKSSGQISISSHKNNPYHHTLPLLMNNINLLSWKLSITTNITQKSDVISYNLLTDPSIRKENPWIFNNT